MDRAEVLSVDSYIRFWTLEMHTELYIAVCPHVKCPHICPILTVIEVTAQFVVKFPCTKFHEYPFVCSCVVLCRVAKKLRDTRCFNMLLLVSSEFLRHSVYTD
jgi:hypothetical protein